MSRIGFITPDDIPSATVCRTLFIPDSIEWLALVSGALIELTKAYNWEQIGAETPENCAQRMMRMFDEFTFNRGGCRMIGEIIPFAGQNSPKPTQWLPCDGSSLLRADYPDLFAVIGTIYGAADSTHFNLPDYRTRTLIGAGSPYAMGEIYGEAEHTLTESEMPSHYHSYIASTETLINGGLEAPATASFPVPDYTGAAGGDQPHNNMQPSCPVLYLIVARD